MISAVAGFVFYGAWAYAVNYSYGQWIAAKAACVQGSYSFFLTFSMTLLLEALFKLMAKVFNRSGFVNWSTILISCALVFSGSWIVNMAAGTPEIFRTVILGYIIGAFYSVTYVLGLARVDAKSDQ